MCTWVCVLDSLHHTYYSQSVLGSVKMEGHALSQLAHVTVQMATVGTTVEVYKFNHSLACHQLLDMLL